METSGNVFEVTNGTIYTCGVRVCCQCTEFECVSVSLTVLHPHVPVANRTVDQTNIVGDTAVAGANEVSQATVEGVENVAASTGMVNQVSYHGDD